MNEEIKELIISSLNIPDLKPSDIDDESPLFNEGLGLDSVDALELALAIQKKYNIVLDPKTMDLKHIFYNVANLASYLEKAQKGETQ